MDTNRLGIESPEAAHRYCVSMFCPWWPIGVIGEVGCTAVFVSKSTPLSGGRMQIEHDQTIEQ